MVDCIAVGGGRKVYVGDSFKVVTNDMPIPIGTEFTIEQINQTPTDFVAQTTVDGQIYEFTPTFFAKALCTITYPGLTTEPKLKHVAQY